MKQTVYPTVVIFIIMFCVTSSFCRAAGSDPLSPTVTNAPLSPSSDVRFYDFKFDNAPIQKVAEFYGNIVGKEVIVPTNCFDAFTFAPGRNLTKDETVAMIEQNLKTAGLATVHTNGRVELHRTARSHPGASDPEFQQRIEERRQRLLTAMSNRTHKAAHANAMFTNEVPSSMLCMEVYDIAVKRAAEEGVKRDAAGRVMIGYLGTSGVWKVTFIAGTNNLKTELLTILVDDRTQKIISVEKPVGLSTGQPLP